jgi:hypothetical protein
MMTSGPPSGLEHRRDQRKVVYPKLFWQTATVGDITSSDLQTVKHVAGLDNRRRVADARVTRRSQSLLRPYDAVQPRPVSQFPRRRRRPDKPSSQTPAG